jgi:Trm5-related predicted tRNA methylase
MQSPERKPEIIIKVGLNSHILVILEYSPRYLKKSKLKIVHNVNNTIKTKCRVNKQQDRYNSSKSYQLKRLSCDHACIHRPNRQKFQNQEKEHIRDERCNQTKSKYAQHILECNHEY